MNQFALANRSAANAVEIKIIAYLVQKIRSKNQVNVLPAQLLYFLLVVQRIYKNERTKTSCESVDDLIRIRITQRS